eukprot:6842920-Prorocentrum_lima.AAC.1
MKEWKKAPSSLGYNQFPPSMQEAKVLCGGTHRLHVLDHMVINAYAYQHITLPYHVNGAVCLDVDN